MKELDRKKMTIKFHSLLGILSACLILFGCAKIPDKLLSPTIKIEPEIKDNREVYNLKLNAGILNDNSDIALMDVKGAVVLTAPEEREGQKISFAFEIPVILPFETGVIEIQRVYPENEIMPIVLLLGSDKEKLINEKGLERSLMDDKSVRLEISGCKKESILTILKRKPDEKN